MTSTTDGAVRALACATVRVRGGAAEAFLQGQLSQDLDAIGDAGWSLLLAPDSVVLTTCYVRRAGDGFDLVVPSALGETATARLRRFLLRVACSVELVEGGSTPFATWDERVDAGWPGEEEFAAGLTPHAFGRSFVDATISFDKGCFTGQELVGRLDARGSSVPWRLVRFRGPSLERVDAVLRAKGPDGPQGATSVRERDGLLDGLGFAHRTLFAVLDEVAAPDVSVVAVD
jgi:folate-binding protein YgfZ